MSRKFPDKDVKILYGSAANRCSKCGKKIRIAATRTDRTTQTGNICHIVGRKPNAARWDSNFPKEELDKYENWILLCGDCHKEVDDQSNHFTVEMIHDMKKKHEEFIDRKISIGTVEFGFPELKTVIRHINSGKYSSFDSNDNLDVIGINDKIQKNSLSDKTQGLITQGISRSKEVERYFIEMSKTDIYIINEVQYQFQKKYRESKEQHSDGDLIFYEMLDFAQGGSKNYAEESAGLAVLCHLFELCEVFEK